MRLWKIGLTQMQFRANTYAKLSPVSRMEKYLTNVFAAISGKQGFTDNSTDNSTDKAPTEEGNYLFVRGITLILLYVILMFISAVGAARLSYNYNIYVGNTGGAAMGFSILNFFFSGFYYPYYALFLDPLGNKRRNATNNYR